MVSVLEKSLTDLNRLIKINWLLDSVDSLIPKSVFLPHQSTPTLKLTSASD